MESRSRKPVKLEQLELLQQFVKGGVNAQRTVDKIVREFKDGAQPSREDADRRLKNLRASQRRRGRADPD